MGEGAASRARAYRDFDIEFIKVGKKFLARVVHSDGGEASTTFSAPNKLFVENLILRMRGGGRVNRSRGSTGFNAAAVFGQQLFSRVFVGDVLHCLNSTLSAAESAGEFVRIRLRLGAGGELLNLPWEFLFDRSRNHFLALSPRTPVVRYLEIAEKVAPIGVALPLRILVVLSSATQDPEQKLDTEHEWDLIKGALAEEERRGRIVLTRLPRATLEDLRKALKKRYDVVHFIGHGGFDEQQRQGALLFDDADVKIQTGRVVPANVLATLLTARGVRLVVLNACEGGRTDAADPFAGVAQSLLQQGVPAVVAMQFEISDRAAILFAAAFYESIAGGEPIDAATVDARQAIVVDNNHVEWATPVLYLRSPDGQIFSIADSGAEAPPVSVEISPAETAKAAVETVAEKPAKIRVVKKPHAASAELVRILEAAKRGDASAQIEAAGAYEAGRGIGQNYAQAAHWYEKAAQQGSAEGQLRLGVFYEEGFGVKRSATIAARWYRLAAVQGHPRGQYHLGHCYDYGDGVRRDARKAVELYQSAANRGVPEAQYNLGRCYETGHGVRRNLEKAVEWYTKAATRGDTDAQYNLGVCYHEGQGVKRDPAKAVGWYKKAAAKGDEDAQYELARCYEDGDGVPRSDAHALHWYGKAADQEHADAIKRLKTDDLDPAVQKAIRNAMRDHAYVLRAYKNIAADASTTVSTVKKFCERSPTLVHIGTAKGPRKLPIAGLVSRWRAGR